MARSGMTAKARLQQAIKDIRNKNPQYDNPEHLGVLVSILLDYAQELEERADKTDYELCLEAFPVVMSCKKLLKVGDVSLRKFIMGIFFAIYKGAGITEASYTQKMKGWLKAYLGDEGLLTATPANQEHRYKLNVNRFKYECWGGVEMEEENALYDLMRLFISLVPSDNGKAFGFSDLGIEMNGDGLLTPYDIYITFGVKADDVDVKMIEKSLTFMTKTIRQTVATIRDCEGDIGWTELAAKFYEKCNDPKYITLKFGIKLSSIYTMHKMQKEGI